MEVYAFLFGTAVLFTVVGYGWGARVRLEKAVTATIDSLIQDGYLKTRRNDDGEIVILKQNED